MRLRRRLGRGATRLQRSRGTSSDLIRRPSSDAFNGDVVPLRAMMNQLIENAFTPTAWSWGNAAPTFAWDVFRSDSSTFQRRFQWRCRTATRNDEPAHRECVYADGLVVGQRGSNVRVGRLQI